MKFNIKIFFIVGLPFSVISQNPNDIALIKERVTTASSQLFSATVDNPSSFDLLKNLADKGNLDAVSHLSFASLIGAGVDFDLGKASESLSNLIKSGSSRAHTTIAMMLAHNLTDVSATSKDRNRRSIAHYTIAAMSGDPIAQIILGNHYLRNDDCQSAMMYFRRVASYVSTKVSDLFFSRAKSGLYVWPEDDPTKQDENLTLDKLYFLQHMANLGDENAALSAGIMLFDGNVHISRDLVLSEHYFKQAVEGNSTTAMVLLARMHLYNLTETPDYIYAKELIERALLYGDITAHALKAKMYALGIGNTSSDISKAIYHYKLAVKEGVIDAFYGLGNIYSNNSNTAESMKQAVELWQGPASVGHVQSLWKIAEFMYGQYKSVTSKQVTDGRTNTRMHDQLCQNAVSFYRLVAQSGEWSDLLKTAYIDFTSGRMAESLMKYLLLSDLGYNVAHINSGRLLDEGGIGVYNDTLSSYNEAVQIWSRSNEMNSVVGINRLGDLYYSGIGVSKDLIKARKYYEKSAKLGNAMSYFNLGLMAEWGETFNQDIQLAINFYKKAEKIDKDAEIPVFIALVRLEVFSFLNKTIGCDMYSMINNFSISEINDNLVLLDQKVPGWDLFILSCIGFYLLLKALKTYLF